MASSTESSAQNSTPIFDVPLESKEVKIEIHSPPSSPPESPKVDPLRFLLKVGASAEFFVNHLKLEYSVENIRFWRVAEDYHLWFQGVTPLTVRKNHEDYEEKELSYEAMVKEAKQIYSTYIKEDAPQSINISAELRCKIEADFDSIVTSELFIEAQTAIYDLMKADAFPRFKTKTSQMLSESWKRVTSKGLERIGALFYRKLFDTYPGVEDLFPRKFSGMEGKMGKMVVGMVDTVFEFLNNLDKVIPELQQLGIRHAAYGAEQDHFTAVGDTLLWVLENEEEPGQWNEALATAWGNLYQIIGGVMAEAMMIAKLTQKTSTRRSAHFIYQAKHKPQKSIPEHLDLPTTSKRSTSRKKSDISTDELAASVKSAFSIDVQKSVKSSALTLPADDPKVHKSLLDKTVIPSSTGTPVVQAKSLKKKEKKCCSCTIL